MAYNSSTGIVSEPVDIEDIRNATGQSSYNIGEIITNAVAAGAINKWSKVKPLRWDVEGVVELAASSYKGSNTDRQNGIFYGLKTGSSDLSKIHSATWAYVGYPTQDFRYTDFNGYNKNAQPTLSGSAVIYNRGEVDYTLNKPLAVAITWYASDGTNVDIFDMTQSSGDIGGYYVVAVIGEWARVMKNSHQSGAITPIVYNGVKQEGFYLELPDGTPVYSVTSGEIAQPNFQQYNAGLNVSFALCAVDDMADTSLKSRWVHMRNVVLSSPAISLPNVAGAVLPFIDGMNYHGEWEFTAVRFTSSTINIIVNCTAPVQRYAGFKLQLDFYYNGRIETQVVSDTFYEYEGFSGSESISVSNPVGLTLVTKTYTVYAYLMKDIGGTLATKTYTYTHYPS